MGRHGVLISGCALALTFALANSLCAAVVAAWPTQAIDFANAWAHGPDLRLIRANSALTLSGFLYGLVGISVVGFVVGAVYAWVHNFLRRVLPPGE